MSAIETLLSRRSAKALTEPAPDEGALELMFASAVAAPDHGRLRPWRLLVVRGSARERLGELLADHLKRSTPSATPEALARARQKALRAPLIVVVAAIVAPHARVPRIEQVLSAGAAAQNIMLAAYSLGFNAMWKTGDAAYDETVKAALGLKPEDAIVGFLYLGTEPSATRNVAASRDWRSVVQNWEG